MLLGGSRGRRVLVLDDDQYGVSMEQLKKLLRPAVNNNEEDHESKETPSASSPAYRRSMPVRTIPTVESISLVILR